MNLIKRLSAHVKDRSAYVGIVGYPNTGKSSLINLLRSKATSGISLKSSQIKNYNEITISDNLRLFEQSGQIFSKNEVGPLMPKTCKNVEDIKNPLDVLKTLFDRIPHDTLLEFYEIADFQNLTEFLENVANQKNLLIKKKDTQT